MICNRLEVTTLIVFSFLPIKVAFVSPLYRFVKRPFVLLSKNTKAAMIKKKNTITNKNLFELNEKKPKVCKNNEIKISATKKPPREKVSKL